MHKRHSPAISCSKVHTNNDPIRFPRDRYILDLLGYIAQASIRLWRVHRWPKITIFFVSRGRLCVLFWGKVYVAGFSGPAERYVINGERMFLSS